MVNIFRSYDTGHNEVKLLDIIEKMKDLKDLKEEYSNESQVKKYLTSIHG